MKKINPLLIIFAALIIAGCGDSGTSSKSDDIQNGNLVFTFLSDFTTGELRWFSPESLQLSKSSLALNQDSKLIAGDSALFVLERYGADNLVRIDPKKLPKTEAVLYQVSLETGANPSDLVLVDSKTAWLSLEGSPLLIKIKTEDGSQISSIDLSDFAYSGALSPNLVDLDLSGDTLFALIQRLDSYLPKAPGLVIILSLETGAFLDSIPLKTMNPSAMGFAGGTLYVGTQGIYNANYGFDADSLRGIEKVDVTSKKSELVVSGKELGGGIQTLSFDAKKQIAYINVYTGFMDSKIVSVDLKTGKVSTIENVGDSSPIYFDSQNETLWIGDRKSSEIFGMNGKSVSASNILPPYGFASVSF